MASEVSICNQALSWVGANLIISLEDDSTEAKICKANYEPLRDLLLTTTEWTFSTKRASWPKQLNGVVGNYNVFPIPPYALKILEVTDDRGNSIDYFVESPGIIAKEDSILVKYLDKETDVNKYSAAFQNVLAARIAAEIAIGITQSRSMYETLFTIYERKLQDAVAEDGQQGTTRRLRNTDLLRIR